MTETIHIAFAVDKGYLKQAAVTIASIIANASSPDALRFYIVHAEDDAWMAEQLAGWTLPNVGAVRSKNSFAEVGEHTHVSKAAFLRTMLPEVLAPLDRVLYLDADTIILGDIGKLWRFDLGDAAIAGAIDFGVYIQISRGNMRGDYRRRDCQLLIGLDPDKPQYVNSGVLLMDLNKLREMDFTKKFKGMEEAYRGALIFVDQDVINSVAFGRMKILDPRWNVSAKMWSGKDRRRHHYVPEMLREQFALQADEQWLVHWTGRAKPWNDANVWRGEDWWRYAAASGLDWERPKPASRTFRDTVRELWLNLRSGLSVMRYRFHKRAKSET